MTLNEAKTMRSSQDQTGKTVTVRHPLRSIVSLVPSQTELLFDLGLDREISGITDFCIYPREGCAKKTKVGGPKSVDFEVVARLKPDLIIANKEENDEAQVTRLGGIYPTWVSDITTLDDAVEMICSVGDLVGKSHEGNAIADVIGASLRVIPSPEIKAVYVIWDKPLMVAAGNTFIDTMMKRCGIGNCFEGMSRYPAITDDDVCRKKPDIIMLSSEPYPFDETHAAMFRERFPAQKIVLVAGEVFSWYGSRLRYAADYFKSFRHKISLIMD